MQPAEAHEPHILAHDIGGDQLRLFVSPTELLRVDTIIFTNQTEKVWFVQLVIFIRVNAHGNNAANIEGLDPLACHA